MNRRNGDDEEEAEGSDSESPRSTSVREIDGIGKTKGNALEEAGYQTVADLRSASREQLLAVSGIGSQTANLLQAAASDQAPSVSVQLDDDIERTIEETPVGHDITLPTEEARQEAAEATAVAGELYRSTAMRFAARTRNRTIAEAMANHVDRVEYRPVGGPVFDVTAVGSNDTGTLFLPEGANSDDINHEFGHAVSDAFGYGRGWASVEAEREYRARREAGEIDPFVELDRTNSEYLLSQENGQNVEGVPEEFVALIEQTNEAFQRIRRYERLGGNPAELTVIDNYSATGASELFAQMNEFMQSDEPPADDGFLINQPAAIEAYIDVFEPSEPVKKRISALQADPSIEGPYHHDPFSDAGGE